MDDSPEDHEQPEQVANTVPVAVDSELTSSPAAYLTRCVYFTITAEDPGTPFILGLQAARIPFLFLGLQGIVVQPIRAGFPEFVSPDDWQKLVDAVEVMEGFAVDFEYFWLPTELLNRAKATGLGRESKQLGAERGDVFRLSHDLFLEAWRATSAGTDFEGFAKAMLDVYGGTNLGSGLRFSPEETRTMQDWSEDQLRQAQIT